MEALRKAQMESGIGSSRSRVASSIVAKDLPHVPMEDNWHRGEDLYELRPTYYDPISVSVRADQDGRARAGGYMIAESWERALASAVMGLDIAEPEEGSDPAPDAAMTPA